MSRHICRSVAARIPDIPKIMSALEHLVKMAQKHGRDNTVYLLSELRYLLRASFFSVCW